MTKPADDRPSDEAEKIVFAIHERMETFLAEFRKPSCIDEVSQSRLLAAEVEPREADPNPLMSEWIAQYAVLEGLARVKAMGIPDALHDLADGCASRVFNYIRDLMKEMYRTTEVVNREGPS